MPRRSVASSAVGATRDELLLLWSLRKVLDRFADPRDLVRRSNWDTRSGHRGPYSTSHAWAPQVNACCTRVVLNGLICKENECFESRSIWRGPSGPMRLIWLSVLLGGAGWSSAFPLRHGASSLLRSSPSSLSLQMTTALPQPPQAFASSSSSSSSGSSSNSNSIENRSWGLAFVSMAEAIWAFSRPHTIVGSGVSVLTIFLFATPPSVWPSLAFRSALFGALVPSLLMNLYITGLNQLTDVEIDKVNKPYLPIAAGSLKERDGVVIVIGALVGALLFAQRARSWPLQLVLLGSGLLGTVYSLPPFRLKRSPLLAALCILVVRGSLVNLGFFLHAKGEILGADIGRMSLLQACARFPESVALASFFAVFGVVIAIMKDVPDVRGDEMFAIPSFSVKLGARKMFDAASRLLVALLAGTATAGLFAALQPSLTRGVIAARLVIAALLLGLAGDVNRRARIVDPDQPTQVFNNYMHLWLVFYACYALLPLVSFARGV